MFQLEYVQLIHRHGERTPLFFGPHDETRWNKCNRSTSIGYTSPPKENTTFLNRVFRWLGQKNRKNSSYGVKEQSLIRFNLSLDSGREFNCAPGQLTDKGRDTLTSLGQWFRNRYVEKEKLISPRFKKEEFTLRSTNFQRTLESLQSLMQGMFPIHPEEMDVKVNDLTADPLGRQRPCPRLKKLLDQSKSILKKESEKEVAAIEKYFKKNYSPHLSSLSPYALYELIITSRSHGYSKFKSVPEKIIRDLEKYSLRQWFGHLSNQEALALNTGCLLKEMSTELLSKAVDPSFTKKASIFSAHDITIYPILLAMGAEDNKWPRFGSSIIFELLKNKRTEERYVLMRYNRKIVPITKCKTEKHGGQDYCPLDEFLRICNDVYMDNFNEVCYKG